MPRPKKPGAPAPKKRSRTGCWPCKARKVKCGEERPACDNCERQGDKCDYSIKLSWGGRQRRTPETLTPSLPGSTNSHPTLEHAFRVAENISPFLASNTTDAPQTLHSSANHAKSTVSPPAHELSMVDPVLMGTSHAQSQPITTSAGMFGKSPQYEPAELSHRGALPSASSSDHRAVLVQYRGPFGYDHPSRAGFESIGFNNAGYASIHASGPLSPPEMLAPLHDASHAASHRRPYAQGGEPLYKSHQRSGSSPFPFHSSPLSPPDSFTVGPGDPMAHSTPRHSVSPYFSPDGRISVQSILAVPLGDAAQAYSPESHHSRQSPMRETGSTTYGYDPGHPDIDTPKNDDNASIAMFSPRPDSMNVDIESPYSSPEVRTEDMAFEKGGYYAAPVPIMISKSLEPLPSLLLQNPINLVYFHHFINHTARILVPHDCEQNPFRKILPEMALSDPNILKLLLAFSASHRARLLSHPEPKNRIAEWVQNVFPTLRESITQNHSEISNATLAPALMLASLEIVSPNAFEVRIGWQNHLKIARQMILARGQGSRGEVVGNDRTGHFLSRWFAYLDVLGSLSGNKNDQPLSSFYWSSSSSNASLDDEDSFQIDCLMGFTNRCIGILARIAELAKQCEALRINANGDIREGWRPEPDVLKQALHIKLELEEGITNPASYKGCNHHNGQTSPFTSPSVTDPCALSSPSSSTCDSASEIHATNLMFHYGGLIHLYRRVLGKRAQDDEVQRAVRQITFLLDNVRRGSTAEACLLFPMFAAGCDALEEGQREMIMGRLRGVEGFGIAQVQKARAVMQRVWATGKPWESLVEGEFFG